MPSQDVWDETLLGSTGGRTEEVKSTQLIPAHTISRSLIPLAGLLLALTMVSGFEFVLTPGGTAMVKALASNLPAWPEMTRPEFTAPSLPRPNFSVFSHNLTASAVAAETAGQILVTEIKRETILIGKIISLGYQELGWTSLVVAIQTRDFLASELSAVGSLGQTLFSNLVAAVAKTNHQLVQSIERLGSGYQGLSLAVESGLVVSQAKISGIPQTAGFMVASAGASLGEWVQSLVGEIEWSLGTIREFLVAYGEEVGSRWRTFFGSADTVPVAAPTTPVPVSLDQETRSDLKDIKAGITEILNRLDKIGTAPGVPTAAWPQQGVVVVPKGSNGVTPENLKTRVSDMFSDPVNISVDGSGAAGVITPIFRQGAGDDYLFVLTPVIP